jgi:hypothetical protein
MKPENLAQDPKRELAHCASSLYREVHIQNSSEGLTGLYALEIAFIS